MILSKQKPMEEVLGYLEGEKNVFVIGCNGCAQASGTGGPEQVEAGKNVTGSLVVDFLCEKALVKSKLRPRTEQVEAADSILVMTCGVGVQAVAAAVNKLCHPACDTVNMGGTRGEWQGSERCAECGECMLDYTGGICPLTACTKGLLSGQCGGASHGKCEVNPERDCGWELIYNRLKALGRTDKLKVFVAPKDYSRMAPDYKMMSTSKWALERTDEKESA
jgi:hypothetical protein